jgi:hypothetical protein
MNSYSVEQETLANGDVKLALVSYG